MFCIQTPGPGAYKPVDLDVYTKKSPVYTLHNREPGPTSMMRNPGPGAHYPEKVSKCRGGGGGGRGEVGERGGRGEERGDIRRGGERREERGERGEERGD